jgi:TonB family protein
MCTLDSRFGRIRSAGAFSLLAVSIDLTVNRFLILCGVAMFLSSGCSSKPSIPAPVQPTPAAPVSASFAVVGNPVRELCTDDTYSQTEWFNGPVARFSSSVIDLNGRTVTVQELQDWAANYYKRKAERVLWVQVAPDAMTNAERTMMTLLRVFPDLRVRQVEFGFTCPKLGNGEPPVRLTSADIRPTKTVKPLYPEAARKAGIDGVVVLEVVVAKDGSVESTRALNGPRQLVPSASEAVKQWKWEPFLLNEKPVRVATRVSVSFELKK